MKQVKQKKWGRLIVGGAVCAVLGVNALIFPGILEGLTNTVKLQTVQAENLPKEKKMTVLENMRTMTTMPVTKDEPDANAISKEKAIEVATKAHEKKREEQRQEWEQYKTEIKEMIEDQKKSLADEEGEDKILMQETIKDNEEYLKEQESFSWSMMESELKDIKYIAGNAPSTEPMWVVFFESRSGKDRIVPKDNMVGGIESTLKQFKLSTDERADESDDERAQRDKENQYLKKVFLYPTLKLEDYLNPEIMGHKEEIGEDGLVYVNYGEEIECSFYHINARTGEVISGETAQFDEAMLNVDSYYELEYGFNPGFND